jgi:hypothetical protein
MRWSSPDAADYENGGRVTFLTVVWRTFMTQTFPVIIGDHSLWIDEILSSYMLIHREIVEISEHFTRHRHAYDWLDNEVDQ